jgi:hypothetical protein
MSRGVSQLVGFVLVFTIVLSTAGVAYTAGVSSLGDVRSAEQANNAERGFQSLAHNIDDMVHSDATRRVTSVRLGGGTLTYGETVTMNLTVVGEGVSYGASYRPLVYETENGERFVYSGGMVTRGRESGHALVRQPPFRFGTDTLVPFVVTRPTGSNSGAVSGRTTVAIRTSLGGRQEFTRRTDGPYTIRFNVTTPRTGVWQRTLESNGLDCSVVDTTTVTCETTTQSLHVALVRLNVKYVA